MVPVKRPGPRSVSPMKKALTMNRNVFPCCVFSIFLLPGFLHAGGGSQGYPLTPVPFTAVQVDDLFWGPRLETNRVVTIPYALRQCVETGRIRNFELADSVLRGNLQQGTFCSRYGFDDSDVFKIIEGASYSLHIHYDAELDRVLDSLITKIAAAQEKDGYLYTMRTMNPQKSWAAERWVNDRVKGSHELYNAGHLYEAAVAHHEATGKSSLLAVARKNADLLCATFGPGKARTVPGHQVIEIGLSRLFLVTGERKYLDLAKFFLDERGHPKGETYNQDHLPVIEQTEAVGHSVRAAYMYSGMADVAALTGDESYISAIDRIWQDVVGRKMYLTGGIGAVGNTEGFGAPYELPNLNAYCETCASIANVFWNYRMFLRHADARYLDIVERVIYNGFLSGVSMTGDRFFYPNPLEAVWGKQRSPWFACACCPSNIVRFIPSIPGYVYAHRDDTLFANLFIGGRAEIKLGSGVVAVRQTGKYPWDGRISLEVSPARARAFTVALRIPGWAKGEPVPTDLYRYVDDAHDPVRVAVNGEAVKGVLDKGFLRIRRVWKSGDVVTLSLPMPVRRVTAHEHVTEDMGKVALERGPLVFCLEGQDNPGGQVLNLVIPDTTSLRTRYVPDFLGGVQFIEGTAIPIRRELGGTIAAEQERVFTAIPYYAWAHRGPSAMTVWPAREPRAAKPLPAPTIAFTSLLSTSGGHDSLALTDQLTPRHSNDESIPRFHWWPKKGSLEWVRLQFPGPTRVRRCSVYWFDDTGIGECRVPAVWKISYRKGNEWKPVTGGSATDCQKDRLNTMTFDPVETDGLRLEVQLQPGFSAGLYEWIVE
jgi:uncharacterized protein